VLKTCLDFKFVTYNNCENGAAGPYTAFALFAWTFLPSDPLFLNYTKDKQISHASVCISIVPVLCISVLVAYFKTQYFKNHSSFSGR
jgi:hypothetical protein